MVQAGEGMGSNPGNAFLTSLCLIVGNHLWGSCVRIPKVAVPLSVEWDKKTLLTFRYMKSSSDIPKRWKYFVFSVG